MHPLTSSRNLSMILKDNSRGSCVVNSVRNQPLAYIDVWKLCAWKCWYRGAECSCKNKTICHVNLHLKFSIPWNLAWTSILCFETKLNEAGRNFWNIYCAMCLLFGHFRVEFVTFSWRRGTYICLERLHRCVRILKKWIYNIRYIWYRKYILLHYHHSITWIRYSSWYIQVPSSAILGLNNSLIL